MLSETPLSYWVGFHIFVAVLMGLELLYARRQPLDRQRATSAAATLFWIMAALAVGVFIFQTMSSTAATQYLAGYAIEESLSIDNLFVFLVLFRMFGIERDKEPKVLFWGVAGAIVMRGAFIAAGIELLKHFAWISYAFGALLFIAAINIALPKKKRDEQSAPRWLRWLSRVKPVSLRQDCFFTVENGKRLATVLFLALIAIEVTDLVFAIDSIPAVLSITRNPFLAYTSNIMAVMGLRSLYFVLAHLLERIRFLHYGLAAVLAFAAFKMIAADWLEIGPVTSLAAVLFILGITLLLSLVIQRRPVASSN